MKVLVRNHGPEGGTTVEVIDPSDGAVSHSGNVAEGEQIVVTATACDSPADIEFGEVEGIPVAAEDTPEVEDEAEAPADGEGEATGDDEQPEDAEQGDDGDGAAA